MVDKVQETELKYTTKMEKPEARKVATGEQTQITPKVKEVADTIKGEGVVLVMNTADYIKSMIVVTDSTVPYFTRTAEQVLQENKYNGCNEAGAVFAALLRAKGVPTTYIQALKKTAVHNYSQERPSLNGHVFLEADLGGENSENKKIINSTTGEITNELPEDMIVGAKGLDAWDIGLKNGFNDLQKLFEQKHQKLASTTPTH